jgi:ATP-dependent DNA ligase
VDHVQQRCVSSIPEKTLISSAGKPQFTPSSLLYADHVAGTGVDLFETVCRNDLEGIVAKRADAQYAPEKPTWVKIKSPTRSQAEGRRELFEKKRETAR